MMDPVRIHGIRHQIAQPYIDISLIIQALCDRIKFIHGHHPRVVSVYRALSECFHIEGFCRRVQQGMIENVRNRKGINRCAGIPLRRIIRNHLLNR